MKTKIMALIVYVITFIIVSCATSATSIIINPSDDGSIYDNGKVSTSAYLMAADYIRGVVEFPISAIDGQIQSATLSVNPYGLPLHSPVVSVYGYSSNDGRLTSSDYDAGVFLGDWLLPNLGYGRDAYFDITTFLKTVTTPYVGFNLRTIQSADVFSSLEYNYGHPSQLSVVIPEPATILLLGFGGLVLRKRK